MGRERSMFGDVIDPSIKVGSKQGRSVLLTAMLELSLVLAIFAASAFVGDFLPMPQDMIQAWAAPAPAPEPPPPSSPPVDRQTKTAIVETANIPTEAPREIFPEAPRFEPRFEPSSTEPTIVGGGREGVIDIPAPPPPQPPKPSADPPRVGGVIKAPAQTRRVNPVYPTIAQSARVQGVVILEALIGEDGRVRNVKILRSIPLLDQAAIDAVSQWEYTPTLLNNVPTPVIMTVTVQFSLQ